MQPRLFDPSKPFVATISMVVSPPNQLVLLLGTKESAVRLMLHWVGGISLPCVEGECPYCHLGARPYAYAPVHWFKGIKNNESVVEKAILPVPFTSFDFLDEYDNQTWYEIGRKNNAKSGRMTWKKWNNRKGEATQPFYVLSHLMRLWEKRIGKLAPVDTWKQFIPKDSSEVAA